MNQFCLDTDEKVSFDGPKRIGYFSCFDNDSVYSQDKSALRYLDLPDPVSINCLQGYDPNVKYGHVVSRDTLLLRWVLDNAETVRKFPSDFICHNGILKDMMIAKYYNEDWNFSATKIRGQIVLNKFESDEKKEHIDTQSEWRNRSTYAADSLQGFITTNNNDDKCVAFGDEDDSFYGVFHSKIGSHRILHAGWLDCVESKEELDKPFDKMKFVLIKKFNAPRESKSLLHANTWWSLATLAGVDTIVCAKCEQDFTVKSIDKLKVGNLTYKKNRMTFLTSLDRVLDYIESIVEEEKICYNFHFDGEDKKFEFMGMDP